MTTPENIDPLLDAQAAAIEAQAQAALVDLLALMASGMAPDRAVWQVLDTFNGAFEAQLQRAFTQVLGQSVTARQIAAMPVGGLPLSARLYNQAARTSLEVEVLVRQHAAGMHDARALAIRLYDGYNPKDGVQRPLEARSLAQLPRPLRELMRADIKLKGSYEQLLAEVQAAAARLKTGALKAAYTEAIDRWAKGKGQEALLRKLDVAFKEKTRYHANRIAQTELARAHQDKVGTELMLDESISVVQIVMAPKHPLTDICDFHAKADLFGLGKGCYPKAKAPKPTFHPFCRCVARSRPDLSAARAREVPGGAAAHLRAMPVSDAARVVGSRARLQALLNGADLDEVINAGKNPAYHLSRLGQLDLSVVHPARVAVGVGGAGAPAVPVAPAATASIPAPLPAPSNAPWFSGSSADKSGFMTRGRDKLHELLQMTMPNDRVLVPIISQRGKVLNDLLNDDPANLPDVAVVLHHFINQELKTARAVGGQTIATMAKSGKGNAIMRKVADVYPDDWVSAGNARAIKVTVSATSRGKYTPWFGKQEAKITTSDSSTAVHEYAHHLQAIIPELDKIFQDEHKLRTASEALAPINHLGELGKKDGYHNAYQGREYTGYGSDGALEVLTMALQPVLGGDKQAADFFIAMLEKDLDMLRLTIGVLFHFKP